MNKALKWVLSALVIIAVILGWRVYVERKASLGQAVIPGSELTGAKADPKSVLNPPPQNATDAQKRAYGDMVVSTAVRTDKIDISSCYANPLVSSFSEKSDLTFTNGDATVHTVVIDANHTYQVPAKSSKTIKAEFGKGPGIYGFGCDQLPNAIGMMVVTK